eukprot:Gb_26840 [translate_table: standard]
MNTLRKCCSPPYNYKQLGRIDSDERSRSLEDEESMKVALRHDDQSKGEVEFGEVAVSIDDIVDAGNRSNGVSGISGQNSRSADSGGSALPSMKKGADDGDQKEKVGGIWRESSYDFWNDPSAKIEGTPEQADMEGGSEDRSRSFDFRSGEDPPSKLIGDFLHRQRISGQMSLDMDIDMDELRWPQTVQVEENRPNGSKSRTLSPVPEASANERISNSSQGQSETNSPQKAALRSSPRPTHPFSSLSPDSSLNACSQSASPRDFRVSFESRAGPQTSAGDQAAKVAIGSPVYEGGPRYRGSETGMEKEGEFIVAASDNSNQNTENAGSERRKSDFYINDEVLKCSGRIPSNRNLIRTKTRSRLIDPPPPTHHEIKNEGLKNEGFAEAYESKRRSGQQRFSAQLKSGLIGKTGMLEKLEEDEDDPFKDDDLPDDFKRAKWGFMTILQWVSFFVIITALVCSLTINSFNSKKVWDLHLWKWCVLVLVLFSGRLVSGWAIRIVVFFVERNFMLRKRVLYFVYGVRKAVQNCLWLGLVLIAWHYLFDKKVERETRSKTLPYVTKVLVCLLVGTIIWLVKTLLVKVLASSFHVSTYFDRIQESLFNQYVLETLSGPPVMEIERCIKEEKKLLKEVAELTEAGVNVPADLKNAAKSGMIHRGGGMTPRSGMIGKSGRIGKSQQSMGIKSGRKDETKQDDGITIDHLHKLNQKNISAWNMKRLMNLVRHGVLSTLDASFHDVDNEDESTKQIRSEWEAKAAAKKIFKNVAKPGAKCIGLEDLMRFLRDSEAVKALSLFEGAQENNRVTKAALKNWAVNVFRERRALALTLNDTKTAVNKLHHMVNVVVGVVIIVIWLLILGIATTHIIVLMVSQLVLVAFIFGNTLKTVFESLIFLFVMHPFDVGDRCSVESVQMVVEEMNIMNTIFLRYDNEKISYPNSVLATKPISNFYRSPDMGDAIDFTIHIATPVEKVSIMKERIKRHIENKQEHWYPNPLIVVKDIEEMNKMKMAVWLQHRMNHQDMGEKWLRRSHLIEEMINIFRDLDIEYRMLPLDVNTRAMPALASISNRLPSTWMT